MSMVDRINILAKEMGTSVSAIEKALGLSNGIIGKWKKQSPSCDKLKLVADYLNTTIDFLMTGEIEQARTNRSIHAGNMTNSKIVSGYDNSVATYGAVEDNNMNNGAYFELISYLETLSPSKRRHALADLMDILEENYPI